jgi:hypothetical protein
VTHSFHQAMKYSLYLIILTAFAGAVASGQTSGSASLAPFGTLTYTVSESSPACGATKGTITGSYLKWEYTGFVYLDPSGATHSLAGTATYIEKLGPPPCPGTSADPVILEGQDYSIEFVPSVNGGGSATLEGIGDPLYKVVSVLYSPPGNQSSQGFGTSTTDGTSTTIGNSFSLSKELSFTSGIPNVLSGSASTGFSTTSSNSSAFTQTWTDATTLATDDNSNTTYNPAKSDAVNHNLDSFIIWLNPQVTVQWSGAAHSYSTASQPTSGVSALVADMTPPIPAAAMEATPPGTTGLTTVPVAYLIPQAIASDVDGVNSYMPGLGAICKNSTLYKEQLASASPSTPTACTQANQCGCLPSDFVTILQTDPLLNYNGTTLTATPYAGTESPLELDASGASMCAENPVLASADCRYEIVPIDKGSTTPTFETLSGSAGITFTQSDATITTETIGGSKSTNVGLSFSGGPIFASLKTALTWTWTDSESTGNSTSEGNSMSVTFKTSDTDCEENVNIYEDTVYHTYAFQVPTGNTSCP